MLNKLCQVFGGSGGRRCITLHWRVIHPPLPPTNGSEDLDLVVMHQSP